MGTSVSAAVLLLVAGMNIHVAWGLIKQWRAVRARRRSEQAQHHQQMEDAAAPTATGDDGYHVHVTTFGSVLEVRGKWSPHSRARPAY